MSSSDILPTLNVPLNQPDRLWTAEDLACRIVSSVVLGPDLSGRGCVHFNQYLQWHTRLLEPVALPAHGPQDLL